ncbi:peroxiredoxin family protein [Xanthomonas sp. WHRI 7945]|nr:hypothetical protein [Xanthomonas campestris pv. campestris]
MRSTPLLAIALAVACSLVAVLGYQNRQWQALQDQAFYRSLRPQPGTWLPPLEMVDVQGRALTVAGGSGQLIYFFQPGCPVCERSNAAVRSLQQTLQQARTAAPSMIGMGSGAAQALRHYAQSNAFAFPVAQLSGKSQHLLGAKQVPLLVLIDDDGKVLYSHVGLITNKNKDDVTHLMIKAARKEASVAIQ